MRILMVADGRSPNALNWMRYFAEREEVYLASTFYCAPSLPLKGVDIVPVAFSGLKRTAAGTSAPRGAGVRLRTVVRQWFGPLTIPAAARQLQAVIDRVQPDLIHAMRIPFEGMLAAKAASGIPLLVSVWGNDFTLHAPSTPLMAQYTRYTMSAAEALHTDCERDVRLAKRWGLIGGKPVLVIPGNGGIRTDVFHPPSVPASRPIVVNPRGLRAYIRNDVFFRAVPLVLEKVPEARFLCTAMSGEPEAEGWLEKSGARAAVELLPALAHDEMGALFRRAQVVVSPAVHDGTPNSLLEGMACGCFPVAGNLESIREWITDGQNGLLVRPTDARALAEAIVTALKNKDLRATAAGLNHELILARAEYSRCMAKAGEFYAGLTMSR